MGRTIHLMLAIVALSGCESVRQETVNQTWPWPFPPDSYACTIERDVGQWRMRLVRSVAILPDGETWDRVEWRWLRSGAGVRPGMEWRKRPDGWGLWQFYFHFATAARPLGRVRMEIRRSRPAGPDGQPLLVGNEDYHRPSSPQGGLRTHQGNFDLRVLQALVGNRELLAVVLVGRNGDVRDSERLDPAWLSPPMDAAEAARPELDAMAADYANRCTPEQPIIVTRALPLRGGHWNSPEARGV